MFISALFSIHRTQDWATARLYENWYMNGGIFTHTAECNICQWERRVYLQAAMWKKLTNVEWKKPGKKEHVSRIWGSKIAWTKLHIKIQDSGHPWGGGWSLVRSGMSRALGGFANFFSWLSCYSHRSVPFFPSPPPQHWSGLYLKISKQYCRIIDM